MTKNTERVIKAYTDAGFNLDGHSFKSIGKNQVRATIRTVSRIHKTSKYTIDLFCDPLIRAGFKVVRYSTKSDPMPTIIPIYSFDPVRNAEIQDQLIANSSRLKGTLSILIDLPEDIPVLSIRSQYKLAYSIVKRMGDFATYNTLCNSYGIERKIRQYAFDSFYNSELED